MAIYEICNTHKTCSENRPEPWVGKSNNPLSQNFGDFSSRTNIYTIHLCIYGINMKCKKPFLEFLLSISDIPEFPKVINLNCPNFESNFDDENTYFMNECLTEVINLLKRYWNDVSS
jgi:hypothetical protein